MRVSKIDPPYASHAVGQGLGEVLGEQAACFLASMKNGWNQLMEAALDDGFVGQVFHQSAWFRFVISQSVARMLLHATTVKDIAVQEGMFADLPHPLVPTEVLERVSDSLQDILKSGAAIMIAQQIDPLSSRGTLNGIAQPIVGDLLGVDV
jgi:hypothetical protein